jgi:hypothetical protein
MDSNSVRKGLFQDTNLEEQLFEVGYIKIPFLESDELESLKRFYYGVHPAEKIDLQGTLNGIHMTTWSDNFGYKKMVESYLSNIFNKGCDRVFKDHRLLNHVFIAKESGETEFNVHQDWSVVDETRDYSVNIWVPLHDVSERNGALWIIPGSHQLNQPIRGAGCLFPDYITDMEALRDKVECIDVRAGEALIFFHATIHGSPPNKGNERRVVACCTAVHESAELRTFFQRDENSELEVYNPNDDFVYGYRDIMNDSVVIPPQGRLVEKRPPLRLNKFDLSELL